MSDTAAIVLAAGLSRRMGDLNKLLLHVGEDILLAHVVSCLVYASCSLLYYFSSIIAAPGFFLYEFSSINSSS